MSKFARVATAAICLTMPNLLKRPLLRLLGHRVARSARIGLSVVCVDRLYLGAGVRVGPFNLIVARRIVCRDGAYIGTMNVITGHFNVGLGAHAAIGNRNLVLGEKFSVGQRPARLALGTWSKITAGHYINVSESIELGQYTTIAGAGSQLWTHGYVHMSEGLNRAEVRGKITVGDNVYIGSHSCIAAGVRIGDRVAVGAHASVAKSLLEPGVYVPQPLRYIATTPEQRLAGLQALSTSGGVTKYWRESSGTAPHGAPLPKEPR